MFIQHLRDPRKFKSRNNLSQEIKEACLRSVEADLNSNRICSSLCEIQPCFEEDVKVSLEYQPFPVQSYLEVAFTFPSFIEETIEERPSYTWTDLFANFGGSLGLMTGASILSFAELIIFFILYFIEKCGRLRAKRDDH